MLQIKQGGIGPAIIRAYLKKWEIYRAHYGPCKIGIIVSIVERFGNLNIQRKALYLTGLSALTLILTAAAVVGRIPPTFLAWFGVSTAATVNGAGVVCAACYFLGA